MRVKELLKRRVESCTALTSLDVVARTMWEGECGAVPVVDAEGRAVGIVTDRDIAMAMAAKNRSSSHILVRELLGGDLVSCGAEDEVAEAIKKMRAHRVRRLPVVDPEGRLVGLLSLRDLAAAADGTGSGVSYQDLAMTLKEVCASRYKPGERRPQWPWVTAESR